MVLTTAKIRKELAKIKFSTAHARLYKANTIAHLSTYEGSMESSGEIDLSSLYAVYCHLAWLADHVRLVHDKQVKPSQRVFLANAITFIFNTYEMQKGV